MTRRVMKAERLSAFTDGVLAIVLTIMVLELPVPHGEGAGYMRELWPLLGAYALSFVNIGIFWANHHHMMNSARHVSGAALWANLGLLALRQGLRKYCFISFWSSSSSPW